MTSGEVSRAPTRLASILCWAAGVLVAVYAVIAFAVAPAMYPDSGWGILVAESMKRGGPVNHLVEPDPENLARDTSAFSALWSPGQYMLPLAFELLGLHLGSAVVTVTTLFTALGLVGWHALYRSWNFPPLSAAIAIALIAGSRAFALPFGIYNGGEVLLFGTAPWFLLLLGRWRALSVRQAAGIFAAIAVVVFMKLSGLVLAYAALAALVVYDLWPPSAARLRRPAMAALIAGAFAVAFYLVWLSKGATAATGAGGVSTVLVWAELVPRFLEGWAAAFFGMLSLGDLARRIFLYPHHPILASLDTLYLVASVPVLALMAWMGRHLARTHPDYVRFAAATAFFYIVVMTAIYATGGSINMEDRFFRSLSLLLLIGAVHVVATSGLAIRLPLAAGATAVVIYGISSYFVRADYNFHAPLGARGFRHYTLTHDGLALVKQELAGPFDRDDTVVWVISPEIALEIPGARIIPTGEAPGDLTPRSYKGRVAKVFVLVRQALVDDGRADTILKAFRDYDPSRWVAKPLGDFTLYAQ